METTNNIQDIAMVVVPLLPFVAVIAFCALGFINKTATVVIIAVFIVVGAVIAPAANQEVENFEKFATSEVEGYINDSILGIK